MNEEHLSDIQRKLLHIRREAEERDAERRAAHSGASYVDLRKVPVSLDAMKLLPEDVAREARVAVIEVKTKEVALAAFDPGALKAKEVISGLEAKRYVVRSFTASISGLEEAWRTYRYVQTAAKDITGKLEIGRVEEFLGTLRGLDAVRAEIGKLDLRRLVTTHLFEIILAGALANRASDVHFEAEEHGAKIRFRLDGVLQDIYDPLPTKNYDSLMTRIKLISGLKINVHGEPQDGRFSLELGGKILEVRVSIIPSEFGETAVMRILDPQTIMDITALGLRDDDLKMVNHELTRPNGLIINTGPTGSGKTTTLYAFLKTLAGPHIKIITIEDPIEYHLAGVEQTQVDPEVGYTFANGLRSILRQDPDVILVGEVRDLETADAALQASLTGHLVFTTLHANNAVGAVPRLIDLGVKKTSVGPAVSLLIAQRLVRRLCPSCRVPVNIGGPLEKGIASFLDSLPKRVDRTPFDRKAWKVFTPAGCPSCSGFGYQGRIGIFELLVASPDFEELVLKDSSELTLRHYAEAQKMVTIQEDGVLKTLQGLTSFAELEQVTGLIPWLH